MWLHSCYSIYLSTSSMWFSVHWAARTLLLIGFIFGLLAVVVKAAKRRSLRTGKPIIPARFRTDIIVLKVISEFPTVTRFVTRVVPVLAGFALGYMTREIQQYDHTDSYRMHVLQRYEPYRYQVELISKKNGRVLGTPYIFQVCKNMRDPEFDPGMFVDVKFEEQGTCKSFTGEHFGYQALVDEATGKLIYSRSDQ